MHSALVRQTAGIHQQKAHAQCADYSQAIGIHLRNNNNDKKKQTRTSHRLDRQIGIHLKKHMHSALVRQMAGIHLQELIEIHLSRFS